MYLSRDTVLVVCAAVVVLCAVQHVFAVPGPPSYTTKPSITWCLCDGTTESSTTPIPNTPGPSDYTTGVQESTNEVLKTTPEETESTAEVTASTAGSTESTTGVTASVAETTTSAAESTTSAAESTASAAEATTSAAEATTSAAESTASAAETTTSAAEGTTSAAEAITSAAESTASAAEATTSAAESTASAAEATTSAAESTASAAEATTSAAEATTSAAESTASAAEATTTVAEATTTAAEATTLAAESTASAAEATTSAAESTASAAEATTSAAEATTTVAEATTTVAEATTTAAEATTTAAEATTTAAEATTTAAEATASAAEATTSAAEATTTVAEATTTVAEATTTAAEATTTAAEATTTAAEATTTAAEATTTAAEATTTAAEATTTAAEATTTVAEATTTAAKSTASAAEATTTVADATTTAAEATTTAAEATTTAAKSTASAADATTTVAEATTTGAEATTTVAETTTSASEAATTAAEATTTAAEATTTAAEATTTVADATTTVAEATTTGAEATTTAAEATTTGAEATTTAAEATTTGAEATTTVAETTSSAAEATASAAEVPLLAAKVLKSLNGGRELATPIWCYCGSTSEPTVSTTEGPFTSTAGPGTSTTGPDTSTTGLGTSSKGPSATCTSAIGPSTITPSTTGPSTTGPDNCVTDGDNCNTHRNNCATHRDNCVTDGDNCDTNRDNCATHRDNCVTHRDNCVTDGDNCDTNRDNCATHRDNCVTHSDNCVTDGDNCDTNRDNSGTMPLRDPIPVYTFNFPKFHVHTLVTFYLPSKDRISPTFASRQFFPFGNGLYEFIYFTDNGVIILSNNRRVRRTIYKQAFPSTYSFSFNGNVKMIAPFWADVRADAFDSTNNVFWKLYDNPSTDSTMLRTLSNIVSAQYGSFLANWVLVITWSNVQSVSLSFETNTFQAILLTNGEHSYVIFNYDPCGMNWDPVYLYNHYVIQGFTCGRFGRKVYVDLLGRSVFRPGSVVGNSGMIGRWVYQLDTLQANFINPRLFCYNWYYRQRSSYIFFLYLYPVRVANTCPCSLQSARRDRRWVPIPYSYVLPTQFSLRFDQGVLVRYYCCEQSSLCRLYRRWRPIQSCRRYRPPRRGWNFGDPHMRTLDGLDYTFNGLGEYTMALIDDDDGQRQFELQGRTQRALNSETQQLSEATFFAGFAAEYVGDARIEIKLNSDGTDLETKVNGASVTPTADGLLIGNFTVLREEDPIKIIAVYQADIQFSVGVSNSFADITTQLSEDYMNKTKGLLGVWDGDKGNDALRRDNTQQTVTGPNGEQSEQDFFAFGQTWAISESDSLFYYVPPGESFSNMNDPSFTPKFLDNLTSEADPAKLQAAQDACGSNKVCLYDALATGSTDIGVASMQLSEQNTIDMMAATNFPPNVTLVETVEVVVGQPFILQIQAVDPDGDDISYELLEVIPGATVSSPGGQFTWTPADRSKVTLGFLVTDGKANATLEPIVKLCDCKNAGTCLYDEYVEGTNVITDGRFGVVLCNCTPGWSGDFCEMNYDACQDNPCFLGVACFDDDPPSLNFTCGSCPEGTEGDGKSCIDIDECVVYRDEPASNNGRGCDQNCVNTLASFNCSCNSGYSLFVDGKRCIDINECDSQTDDCADDATCNNTQGSYECSCNTGFNGDGTSCQDINECIGTNDCDNGAECANTIGSYRCQCRQGYEGSGFTCTDVNECSRNTDECNIQAMCDNTEGSYTCTCNEGLSGDGRNCTNVNECEGSTPVCHENATCTDIPGSFNCRCNAGFNGNGTDCQDIDECDLEIDNCLQNCRNTIGSFECVCHEAFTLLDGSCVANTNCSENSICVNGDCYVNGADIERCLCYRGYQNASDPMVCEDINECNATESYCGPSSTCNNTAGGFECLCSEGFRQGNDQRDCLDIDECTLPVDDPLYPVCIATAKCYNNHGTYDCRCKSGYEGNGTHCQNIDECQSGHLCVANSTCLDNAGSYTCHCNTGFHGDGRVLCMNIDECLEDPDMCHSLATCSDTEGSYQCNCDSGYQGNGTYCEDVDECMTESHDCASGRAHCVNNDGSYTCTCMNGYVSAPGMLPGRQCDDIDECSLNLDSCDPSVSQCNNTDDGSYICNCLLGFVKDDMNQCIDMNECEDPAACVSRANTECVNLHGSYDCPCRMGFYLQNSECLSGVSYNASAVFNIISGDLVGGNGFNLVTNYLKYRTELKDAIEAAFRSSDLSDNLGDVVISEISLLTDSTALLRLVINLNMSQPEQTIIQPFLSQLTGSSGGQLAPDHRLVGSTFIIGDPKCNSSPCTNGGTCADDNSVLPEGYTCTCLPGYSGKNCEIAPCGNNPCMNDGTCRVVSTTMTGYMCECALGYSGPQCQMIVPCELSNDCMNAATCVNEFVNARGYTCMCGDGFMGENCENECSLTCMNGGTRDPATCQCVCSPPWTGDTCTECSLTCINGGTTDPATCQCVCSPPWTGDTCTECPLTTASCLNGGTLDEEYCECVCPLTHSGDLCQDSNVCLTSDRCSDNTTGHYCVPSNTAFTCECRTYDAYFMEGAACENRRRFALTVVITLLTETYRSVYINPWSSAFRAKAALYKRLVERRLREDPVTNDVISADCVSIQNGSVVATMVLRYPAAPSTTDVQRVLLENRPLTDGDVAITTDPLALRVNEVTDCPPDYCQNGAMCLKSGYYVSMFTYTCSCGTSFTGERCETVIPVPTDVATATTTKSPGGISTAVIVIIIVACVVLFLTVVVIPLCLCLLIRRRNIESTHGRQKPDNPRINYGLSEYTDQSYYQDNGHDTSAIRDEEIRMDRLMNVMSRSSYLQQGLSSRPDFIRPYIVTGTEEFDQDDQHLDDPRDDDGTVGRVAYNPMIYR
ncbi:mucin-4-like [Patiria miniata]|uniref:Mucin-like protein n=1 Tax=Patiria miniata TaxID=46514 RepID=A0A914AEI6_PATMI|nr:mucin-4-like [Patiria miniata]